MYNNVYVKPKIYNFQKKTQGEKSFDLGLGKEFLYTVQKANP